MGAPGSVAALKSHEARAERAFPFVFALVLCCSVIPIWTGRYLPMVDLPQHLSMMQIWDNLDDPSLPFGQFFVERPGFTPYSGYYWVVRQLGRLLNLETANRVFLSSLVLGLPLATLWLLRALNRSPWLALFAVPLAYDFNFYFGFVNHSAGVVLAFAAIAAYVSYLRGRSLGRPMSALLVALPFAIAATHAFAFAIFGAGLAAFCIAFPTRWRTALAHAAPSSALMAWWMIRSSNAVSDSSAAVEGLRMHALSRRVEEFPKNVLDWFLDGGGALAMAAFLVLWVVAVLLARRHHAWSDPEIPARRTMIALAAGALIAYLVLPWGLGHVHVYFIYPRFAVLSCLLAAVAVPLTKGGQIPLLGGAAAVCCLTWTFYLLGQFERRDAEVGDLEGLAARMARGSCIAPVRKYFKNPVTRGKAGHAHDVAYLALLSESVPGFSFAYTKHSPIALRAPDGTIADRYEDATLPFVSRRNRTGEYGTFYRYVLTQKRYSARAVFGSEAQHVELVGTAGPNALYLNRKANCGRPVDADSRQP
jgi:MFS family permease